MDAIEEIRNVEKRYQVHEFLGEGGSGDVFIGHDPKDGTKVVVKVQKAWRVWEREDHASEGRKLIEEGEAMRRLSGHRGIPRLLATGTYRDDVCLVMEFIEGQPLRDVLAGKRPVKHLGIVASVIGQLCEILWPIHGEDFAHGDLKPENIMVEPDGRLRLIDLGLAARIGQPTQEPHGTTGYASDEQLEPCAKGLTGQSDIFSLGCILLEMAVMRLPYGGAEKRVERGYPVLPPDRLAAIPPEFRDLALHMVQWDPEDRPRDVREVMDRIRRFLPSLGDGRPPGMLDPDPTEYYRTFPPGL
ncbi:serine/threonine-protein kinase [Streptomyces sp. NPDC046374]|uniref:serine/threonine protein kinase n=1 Tax=Streptomyces sp. NPDC046374 TaxID=3154917 RepID=UPI0033CAE8EB